MPRQSDLARDVGSAFRFRLAANRLETQPFLFARSTPAENMNGFHSLTAKRDRLGRVLVGRSGRISKAGKGRLHMHASGALETPARVMRRRADRD